MIFPLALPLLLGLFVLLLIVMVLVVELRILRYAYRKIGVPPRWMFVVMLVSLLGSQVNIPLFAMRVAPVTAPAETTLYGRTYLAPPVVQRGATVVAINVGGALVPLLLSLYLFLRLHMRGRMLLGTAIVAVIVHALATIVPGVGIAVPMFLPPIAAALVSLALARRQAPPLAYVAGSMGALLGAALLNLPGIAQIGASSAASGCGVMRASAHARRDGSRSRNSRLSASAFVGPVVSAVTSFAAVRLTISATRSPGMSASASTNTSRPMRSRAASAAFWMAMPPELVPARTTSLRSS